MKLVLHSFQQRSTLQIATNSTARLPRYKRTKTMKKIIITAVAAVAIIAPNASFASGIADIPTFNFKHVVQSGKAVQPVTKLNIQTASEAVRVPVQANEQK